MDNAMACLEHETTVADREQMHHAITLMGFHPTVRIVKTRRTATLGSMTICVDEVEHAGAFVEIERTVSGENPGPPCRSGWTPSRGRSVSGWSG
ncbi:CYTH domain-containing protein [Streptosporangium sp. NPDC023825]|uniref:CYTH domain-containing protein n=1 Tax=Streptosporangium sp. NPDC023825 TaxID=3154909 RepID=UPI00342E27B5